MPRFKRVSVLVLMGWDDSGGARAGREQGSGSFLKCSGGIQDAKQFCREFFDWYNAAHHHTGLGLMIPNKVHYGQIEAIHAARQTTLDAPFAVHLKRFVKKPPSPPEKPAAVWINPPKNRASAESLN
jgi:hypothetical protein